MVYCVGEWERWVLVQVYKCRGRRMNIQREKVRVQSKEQRFSIGLCIVLCRCRKEMKSGLQRCILTVYLERKECW